MVDASIVVGAAARGDLVVTSDPEGLNLLRDALQHELQLQVV